MGFLSQTELQKLGFKSIGENVLVSDKASFYGCSYIEIGDNSRIDDFCVLSAGQEGIKIGRYVHIAVFCSIIGTKNINFDDYSCISSRVSVYSSSDDYSGKYMTNPTVPKQYTNVISNPVKIGKHVVIGSGSVILPGVHLSDGCAVGSLSLIVKDCLPSFLYAGIPAKKIKIRSKNIFKLENDLSKRLDNN